MLRHLLLTTAAVVALGSAPLLAQNETTQPQTQTTQPAPQPAVPTPPTPPAAAEQPAMPPAATSTDAATQAAVTPPPSNAIIPQQSPTDMRAEKLIGMRVYNANGDEVGKVNDILLDKDGKVTGVVLSVGGVFGIGAKSVGLAWTELDVSPQQNLVQVSYTKQQLESVPDFKPAEPAAPPSTQ